MVDYVPWPTTGCSLAEARERTAERAVWDRRSELLRKLEPDASDVVPAEVDAELQVIEAEISAICLDHLTSLRLIAYGSPGPKQIDKNDWRLFTAVDWGK